MEYYENKFLFFAVILGYIVVVAGIALLIAFPVKWCWNYTMPELFGLPQITWGKAWCLLFLANSFLGAVKYGGDKK